MSSDSVLGFKDIFRDREIFHESSLLFDFFNDGPHHRNLNISCFVAPKIIVADSISGRIFLAGNFAVPNRPGLNDVSIVCHIGYTKVFPEQIVCLFKHLVP